MMPMTEDFAARIGALVGVPAAGVHEVGTRHGFRHLTGALADGRGIFVKAAVGDGEAPEAFAAEANGLRWLAQADAVPIPAVLGADESTLVIELLLPGEPTPEAARDFGAALARMHAAGAPGFGAPWPGYIASLPLDNTPRDDTSIETTPLDNTSPGDATLDRDCLDNAREPDWGSWYAERRLAPYLKRARDAGLLSAADACPVESVIDGIRKLAGPPEPPSRTHGDLWAGNVLWPRGRAALIDPAAHGGHRETDLAMLALFGAPYLERDPARVRRDGPAGRRLALPRPAPSAPSAAGPRLPVRRRLRSPGNRGRPPSTHRLTCGNSRTIRA